MTVISAISGRASSGRAFAMMAAGADPGRAKDRLLEFLHAGTEKELEEVSLTLLEKISEISEIWQRVGAASAVSLNNSVWVSDRYKVNKEYTSVVPDKEPIEANNVSPVDANNDMIKAIIERDIRKIQNGESSIIEKWYGKSDVYTPNVIGELSKRVVVNFMEEDCLSEDNAPMK